MDGLDFRDNGRGRLVSRGDMRVKRSGVCILVDIERCKGICRSG